MRPQEKKSTDATAYRSAYLRLEYVREARWYFLTLPPITRTFREGRPKPSGLRVKG